MCLINMPTRAHIRALAVALLIKKRRLLRLDDQLDCAPYLVVDGHIGEFRDTGYVNAVEFQVTSSQHEGFYCLVNCSGSNGLYFCVFVLAVESCGGNRNLSIHNLSPNSNSRLVYRCPSWTPNVHQGKVDVCQEFLTFCMEYKDGCRVDTV